MSLRPHLRFPVAVAALALTVASATAAQAAVTQSVYTVTEITQTSSVQAALGTSYSWDNAATLRYRASPGRNLVVFDFPTRSNFDPFTRGGTDPRNGILQAKAASVAQTGGVVQNGLRCAFTPVVPAAERDFRMQFFRASKTAKTVLVQVIDQTAVLRADEEKRSGRLSAAGCDRMPGLGTEDRVRSLGDDSSVSFAVPRSKFRKATGARPVNLVLKGTRTIGITSNPGVIGSMTVTTTVKMRLIRSKS